VSLVEQPDGRLSYREAIAMIDTLRREFIAELRGFEAAMDAKLETHYARHEKDSEVHQGEHRRDADRRNGYLRWAVTTIMTGAGVLVAIYAALGRG
jgi:hypothetical protein